MQRRIAGNSGQTGHQGWYSQAERAAAGKARGAALAAALLLAGVEGLAQGKPGKAAAQKANPETAQRARRIIVGIPDRKLALMEDGRVVKIYRVATGARVSPSPAGEFRIVHRIPEPTYYAPSILVPPGPENPLGTRWIGLSVKGFGIHGTNQPRSIGHSASHGCIRMRNRDVEELFEMVRPGDTVEIAGERTEELAEIFGGPKPAAALVAAQKAHEGAGQEISLAGGGR